jgi:hypothetical protein
MSIQLKSSLGWKVRYTFICLHLPHPCHPSRAGSSSPSFKLACHETSKSPMVLSLSSCPLPLVRVHVAYTCAPFCPLMRNFFDTQNQRIFHVRSRTRGSRYGFGRMYASGNEISTLRGSSHYRLTSSLMRKVRRPSRMGRTMRRVVEARRSEEGRVPDVNRRGSVRVMRRTVVVRARRVDHLSQRLLRPRILRRGA